MNHDTSDWKDHKEYIRKQKAKRRQANLDTILAIVPELEDAGISHHKRSDYHFTFYKGRDRVDVYPTTLKFHYPAQNKRGYFASINELKTRLLNWKA